MDTFVQVSNITKHIDWGIEASSETETVTEAMEAAMATMMFATHVLQCTLMQDGVNYCTISLNQHIPQQLGIKGKGGGCCTNMSHVCFDLATWTICSH